MTIYAVTAARFDTHGEVAAVLWASVSGATNTFNEKPYQVPVDRVVEAFDRGDTVELRFATSAGHVSGGRLLRKVLPGGYENVHEERGEPGRTLKDLPSF